MSSIQEEFHLRPQLDHDFHATDFFERNTNAERQYMEIFNTKFYPNQRKNVEITV
jgi:hypothetical protein